MAQGGPSRREVEGASAFALWKRMAVSRGGIAAFLARPEKGWKPDSGTPPLTNMVLKVDGVEHGMLRMTMEDEGGKPRIIFFVPKMELAQACADSLREEKGPNE